MPDMQLTRQEIYLSAIITGSSSVPDPYTREECYLAKIAGKSVSIPAEPITQYEMYLAKLAGQDVSVPVPQVTSPRLFFFLYAACGYDITLPVPVTREEKLWAEYKPQADKDISDQFVFTEKRYCYHGDGAIKNGSTTSATLTFVDISDYKTLRITVCTGTNTGTFGLAFYREDNKESFIEGSGIPRPVGKANGDTVEEITVPEGAKYIRTTYWPEAHIEQYNNSPFSCIGIK